MELTILKWNKYNPRKDIKHPSWFALSNRFLEDPDLFGFEPIDLKAMLYLFCQASQRNSPDITVNFSHAERVCLIKSKNLKAAIEKLNKIGAVRIRTDHERARTQTSRDNTIQDTTDKTRQDSTGHGDLAVAPPPVFRPADLVEVWNENCGTLPKVRELGTGQRADMAALRCREKPDRAYWTDVVKRIALSRFCNGQVKSGEWVATFEFLVRPDTHLKVLEGKYDNKDGSSFDDTNWGYVFNKANP